MQKRGETVLTDFGELWDNGQPAATQARHDAALTTLNLASAIARDDMALAEVRILPEHGCVSK